MIYRVLYEGQMNWPWRVQTQTLYGETRIVASFSTLEAAELYIAAVLPAGGQRG